MRSVCQFLLLARLVAAITGPRIENDFDRNRPTNLGHPGFNEHQTRFGLNSPLQNFQQQPAVINNAPQLPFPQPILNQQPYVPQFNSLLPAQNIPNNAIPIQNSNNFQFNQQSNANPQLNNFHQNVGSQNFQQSQNIQQAPTIPTFQNSLPLAQNPPIFNHNPNIPSPLSLTQQRPTQAAFLPTLQTAQSQQSFNGPNPITIQAAPNLAPQNHNQNGQVPFQASQQISQPNNQGSIFTNPQPSDFQQYYEQQSKENLEKLKELQERQRIIQKHQEFVQKQQQKQQEKVEKLHDEFLSRQATKSLPTYTTTENYEDSFRRGQEKRRPILPHETDLFKKALDLYEQQHPTTTTSTTTTTTTTQRPRFIRTRPTARSRTPPQDRNKQKLYNDIKNLLEESETKGFDDNLRAKSVALLQKPDILKQLKVALAENPEDFSEKNFTSREISLNGQKYEVIRTNNPNLIPKGAISADSPDLGKLVAATQETQKESHVSFDDLTKGVLPPGANFELVKQGDNGKLEEVSALPNTLPNKKKVTFVFLEEQDDGSYKVKGVKANGQQTEEGPEVEEILNRIRKGEISLPGPTKISNALFSSTTENPTTTNLDYIAESSHNPSTYTSFVTTSSYGSSGLTNPVQTTPAPIHRNSIAPARTTQKSYRETYTPRESQRESYTPRERESYTQRDLPRETYSQRETTRETYSQREPTRETFTPRESIRESYTQKAPHNEIYTEREPTRESYTQRESPRESYTQRENSRESYTQNERETYSQRDPTKEPLTQRETFTQKDAIRDTYTPRESQTFQSSTGRPTTERFIIKTSTPTYTIRSQKQTQRSPFPSTTIVNTTPVYRSTPQDVVVIGSSTLAPTYEEPTQNIFASASSPGLIDILKENGLFATAKYLKQSGLDAILNETGPYTIFAPTDKAFRTLLVQLGGPDRAEEKFRDNPRLLSGLLLHHVIPGAFDIASLQDEMTGVSLAGTQLRVNQYDMHDVEWNEVKVTTINGARVIDDKRDIHIPQGIAHAVDRVMFPLPVGDLVQTLQADRDRRFTTFLKAIFASGFADTLAESKTYTVFAPTDTAFAKLAPSELSRYSEKAAARALVARHVLPGTLYSAGMRYYQLRNSMEDAKPLTLQKNSGRIKVNNAQVITHNIPATNGVIHAVDTLL
ncbi:uncharacterized protein LOC125050859 isoform X1 [Pieris napi]|uniref:uncharacterized protein LOC125050859 isoform X1 n=1 Tax=Pieris napi TaxID=78633 RepID=UPI001FB916E2|nr:uncharacterized protein LOC125050859 isoform X1 [Pieris napi]